MAKSEGITYRICEEAIMNLPGLVTVTPEQTSLLEQTARMVGASFREELWFMTWLDALDQAGVADASEARKQAITQAFLLADFTVTAPFGCVLTLPDGAAAANAFLRSDLGDVRWCKLEEQAERLAGAQLSAAEGAVLEKRAQELEPASDTNWQFAYAAPDEDFIYFSSIGVDGEKRGSGAFRRLMDPILAFADAHGIAVYLDCYTDRLEHLYGHFGFKTLETKTASAFNLVERCMMRAPQA